MTAAPAPAPAPGPAPESPAPSQTRIGVRYRRWKAAGICRICGRVPARAPGKYHCEQCLADKALRAKLLRQARLCLACKAPTGGPAHCAECRDRRQARQRANRRLLRERGLCRECGKAAAERAPDGRAKVYCAACGRRANEARAKRTAMLRSNGLCTSCNGRRVAELDRVKCARCAARDVARRKAGAAKRAGTREVTAADGTVTLRAVCTVYSCARLADPGRKTCGKCRARESAARRERYHARRKQGVCTACLRRDARTGRAHCARCARKRADYQGERDRAAAAARAAAGESVD